MLKKEREERHFWFAIFSCRTSKPLPLHYFQNYMNHFMSNLHEVDHSSLLSPVSFKRKISSINKKLKSDVHIYGTPPVFQKKWTHHSIDKATNILR